MADSRISSQRDALKHCADLGELIVVSREIHPEYEIAALTKALDGGPALAFDNVKGYPGWRVVTNILSRRERVASFFGTTMQGLPQRIIDAVQNPIRPRLVRKAPCQENMITDNIDILGTLPVIRHTKRDVGPIISGGIVLLEYPKDMSSGRPSFNLSFHRLNPGLGKDWLSLASLYNRHFLEVLYYHKDRREEFPATINIGVSPALNACASGGAFPALSPTGHDELGVAGNLQGAPVGICRAKTVDAYSLAEAEVVLEGKVLYGEQVFEHPTAVQEDVKYTDRHYFFPEFIGYLGKPAPAFKFQVTGITFRNKPCFYSPLADSLESSHLGAVVSEASVFHACKRTAPRAFVNCHIPDGMRGVLGVVIQCRIGHPLQEGVSQNLISAAFSAVKDLNWVIAVDDDMDIYDPSDILWALTVRTRAAEDINIIKGTGLDLASRVGGNITQLSKWSVDTTVSVSDKWRFVRPQFEQADLGSWLSDEQIATSLSLMNEGAKSIARRRV